MTSFFYINGSFVRESEAKISPLDLGLIRGYGVFDYLRTYGGRPFHLWDHLLRLRLSAEIIGMEMPKSLEEIAGIVEELLRKNAFKESSIKIVITGGCSPDQFLPKEEPSLFVFVQPFKPFDPIHYEGIKTITTELPRSFPTAKTTYYTPSVIALKKAHAEGAFDALHLNTERAILEATTSNFFAFKGETLITASEEIIFGITREILLQIAKDYFNIVYRPVGYEEIASLDEAFVTSSNREIMPVISIDAIPIKESRIGKNTRMLQSLFRDYTHQDQWSSFNIKTI